MKKTTRTINKQQKQFETFVGEVGGVPTATRILNVYRTASGQSPVSAGTVKRYVSGYPTGLPAWTTDAVSTWNSTK